MPLVTLDNLTIAFRGPALLDGVSAVIEPGQKIGLLGRNGAGKSTLMKLIAGEVLPDSGRCVLAEGVHVARLEQEIPAELDGVGLAVASVDEVIRSGWRPTGEHDDWRQDKEVERLLRELRLDPAAKFADLSVGLKRRTLLGRAVLGRPDLLLLDEPTNHLDLAAIEHLESVLKAWPTALLFVTHDREFLRRVATRILEIDRGRLFDWSCDYDAFLERKEQALAAEEKQNALFDKRLAEEERWIRQGIKARRTRNEGRVRALKALRVEHGLRREREGKANLVIQEADRSGALVARAENVSFRYEGADAPAFVGLTTTLMRGDKVGVIGPNGAGKTTLLRTLLGELPPTSGSVRLGTNLQVAYFDQLRGQLDDAQTAEQAVADGYDTIKIAGGTRHIIGYLRDFLFTPDRARTPIQFLSGGERNRLLLAKLFAKPANVIVLDEPTNDLDAETLELLEDRLTDYDGTLLVVSHDRAFLNNVVTSTLVFEDGNVKEYDGGYDDWVRQRRAAPVAEVTEAPKPVVKEEPAKPQAAKKLGFKEKRELESLPATIEKLESQLAELHTRMADPAFYKSAPEVIAAAQAEAGALQSQLDTAYQRWEELEAIGG
ncbi:ATP-binding cassette domain-containing protein [Botrimarina mediterranea]|uniref:ATP-binding cassette domain-containing protein n=1 Tax=Botrimarina mediterranea TaxID=2528022 RepID=UPI0011882C36|nr:ABC transporter ATP-binding protein uup [Planctomycetes bacterium K2D]